MTLPIHHPIKTAIVAAMYEMTEEERVKLGLTLKGDPEDRVLDYQQGGIPDGPDIFRTGRLTSFGTAGGFPSNTGEFLFPSLKGAVFALAGVAWTGEELVYPDGHPKEGQPVPRELREKIALGLLMEGFLPFAGAGRRIFQEQGRPSDPTSSILTPTTRKKWDKKRKTHVEQEGSITSALVDWLNPVGKSRRLTEGDIQIFEDAKKRGQVFEELRKRPSKPKDPRSEFEEFKNKKSEGVREDFDDYRKKAKSNTREDFDAYVGGR